MFEQFLKSGSLHDIQLDDVRDFKLTDHAMTTLGIGEEEKLHIYTIVAGVLHLGNVLFEEEQDGTKGGCVVKAVSKPSLAFASQFLGVDADELEDALINRVMMPKGNAKATVIKCVSHQISTAHLELYVIVLLTHVSLVCRVPLKVGEAQSARDALSKSIYSRLFDYIVKRVNKALPFSSSRSYMGILDIAGFGMALSY